MRARLAVLGRWLTQRVGWIALALAAAVLLLGSVLVFPRLLYPLISNRELDQAQVMGKDRIQLQNERLKLQNDARTTLLQGLGGVVVLLGAWFTYRQLAIGREQLRHSINSSREQLRVAEQGQITERFTRAVDQLGSDQLDVRLGGIYALERIARDSADDRVAVVEVLAAFVRHHAPWPPKRPSEHPADNGVSMTVTWLRRRMPDVQAVMTILSRADWRDTSVELQLNDTDLRAAFLPDARLHNAYLREVHLESAVLPRAVLRVHLRNAHLQHALLRDADLEGVNLQRAHLEEADLRGARLGRARLASADLRGAKLAGADLRGAKADTTTIWPTGFDPVAEGVVLDEPADGEQPGPKLGAEQERERLTPPARQPPA
jgi:hypothetical protein